MEFRSLEIKIARSENLPVLPQIASSVLRIVDDPDSSAREMEKLIIRDSAIAAKVLRVANSAYYGLNNVPSVSRAISILGMNTVRSLVVGIAYQQIVSARQMSKLFSQVDFWRHSVAVATAAKIIGKLKDPSRAEELYSAGLMHDVGILVMDRFAPEELDEAITYAHEQGLPLYQAEQLLFDFDHSETGGLLAEKWGLVDNLRNGIRYHHTPSEDTKTTEFTAMISLANIVANQCDYTTSIGHSQTEVDQELLDMVGIPEGQIEAIRAVTVSEVVKAQNALQIK